MTTTAITPTFVRALTALANRFPADPNSKHWMTLHDRENWVRRVAHDIGVATERIGADGGTICDVGGGYGLFSAGCAMLGMHSILIDDFYEQALYGILEPVQELLSEVGGLRFGAATFSTTTRAWSPGRLTRSRRCMCWSICRPARSRRLRRWRRR